MQFGSHFRFPLDILMGVSQCILVDNIEDLQVIFINLKYVPCYDIVKLVRLMIKAKRSHLIKRTCIQFDIAWLIVQQF